MDLTIPEDQQEVRATFARLFEKESPAERVRAAEAVGIDHELWKYLVDMGTFAISIDNDHGGAGAGLLDMAFVAEEQGRRLASVPLVENTSAARVLADLGSALASELVDGQSIGTLALRPAVNGVATRVPAGAVADLVVALAGDQLVAFRPDPRPLLPNLASLPIADMVVPDDAAVLAGGEQAVVAHGRACADWYALTAAFLVGLASEALQIGVDYVKERKQFGVPIGSFQTVGHRLADCACEVDGARLLAQEAAWAIDECCDGAANLAAAALHCAGRVAQHVAGESLHFHGGYGFMLEYEIHLYYRRAKAWSLLAGDPEALLDHVAPLAFDEGVQ